MVPQRCCRAKPQAAVTSSTGSAEPSSNLRARAKRSVHSQRLGPRPVASTKRRCSYTAGCRFHRQPLKPSKGELQAQVEKLERTVATLRTRSRDAVRAAKQAAARIEELEIELATMKRHASKPPAAPVQAARHAPKCAAAAPPDPKPARSVRGRRFSAKRDPGDAIPPGVAVSDPEPADEEATAAFESLQERFRRVSE